MKNTNTQEDVFSNIISRKANKKLNSFFILRFYFRSPKKNKRTIFMKKENLWNFHSYEKIPETSKDWQDISNLSRNLLKKTPWVVTEKIHGANFCFMTNGQEIRCAKRKFFLTPQENFFAYHTVLKRLESSIYACFCAIQTLYPKLQSIHLYGELFGGHYPHPQVPKNTSVQAVQTGVYYSPHIEFCAFDIRIHTEEHFYLDYEKAIPLFEKTGIFYAKPIFIGSYQKAIEYPEDFLTRIPSHFGLPPLSESNKAEGIVIKPFREIILETKKGKIRPILKKKIRAFSEESCYHRAEKWESLPFIPQKITIEQLQTEASLCVTENRLHNVISKIGYSSRQEKSKSRQFFFLFFEEVWNILEERYPQLFTQLSLLEKKQLEQHLYSEIRLLLQIYFSTESRRI